MKKTKEDLKKFLLDNYVNEVGNLDLSSLDFSDFNGDIHISEWKVKRNLIQSYQVVGGTLSQNQQTVGNGLIQSGQKVKVVLFQGNQCVEGDLIQYCQKVSGEFYTHKPTKDEIMEDMNGYSLVKKRNK